MMKLQTLLSYLHDFTIYSGENPTITSIEMDSRKVTKGALFICIKGFTVDGHAFASQAVANGAVAVIAERPVDVPVPVVLVRDSKRAMAVLADAFYGQPTHKLHLIGVTGTNGKTTTTHLIEQIFRKAEKKTGLIGTLYTKIGDETYDVQNTTPESLVLQQTFKQMVDAGVDVAMMEVSSHALHMGRVHGCDYDVAVFTNLTQDHLDYHHTMEEYRLAKGLLFAQLGNRFDHTRPKFAILNNDDSASEQYKRMTAATIITYGIETKSDIMAKAIDITPSGMVFTIVTPTEETQIQTKLIGRFNVYNILAATAACLASGVSLSTIVEAIGEIQGVPGRFETVDEGQNFTVIVDYAHTPDSLENVLKTIRQFAKRNIYVVVGCGGDRDRTKRPLMAKIAVQHADVAIFTSDNPRSEQPEAILQDMEDGVRGESYVSIVDRKEAIRYAIQQAQAGDVILIAGKGHETYQIIGEQVLHFDDRLVAREAIKEREGSC
ncbi:UDP-N-acetylmuramoyl-L-alanyl-D-glutamate--2,6-diaminopimelate ligase [Anoxybacillus voinovskiensis]|uniref:UDP-N-acetylmuramoyl-L-alanyl-D-glutamate--2,6-diaminopimelate ligase n=2 Tax=Anoxybacteroides voinovskiense TaxID=230470 RepID=A0A840DIF8_9BACL|nr:UDP-N-acetylmuramoyl-L-alanyl-D-glutamate--2,6-diaminopimelate ligase [Anoxybacillus voinovskiensis]GGJ55088.1 UDP-N-acetylmuramoyl-L-alanyl-D-glutamate--2,6-diaminopimelate ligase [Anoxybacillus voinovskiensis]